MIEAPAAGKPRLKLPAHSVQSSQHVLEMPGLPGQLAAVGHPLSLPCARRHLRFPVLVQALAARATLFSLFDLFIPK